MTAEEFLSEEMWEQFNIEERRDICLLAANVETFDEVVYNIGNWLSHPKREETSEGYLTRMSWLLLGIIIQRLITEDKYDYFVALKYFIWDIVEEIENGKERSKYPHIEVYRFLIKVEGELK